jgi:hypothetical protein
MRRPNLPSIGTDRPSDSERRRFDGLCRTSSVRGGGGDAEVLTRRSWRLPWQFSTVSVTDRKGGLQSHHSSLNESVSSGDRSQPRDAYLSILLILREGERC